MQDGRSRSESPMLDYGSKQLRALEQGLPLFNANNARRKAEQDSILLANRIRLLRNEEEKAKKKIRDTEGKTKEILDLRRRGEEKRMAREMEANRKEALEQELSKRTAGLREEQQRKIMQTQKEIAEQKYLSSAAQKQEKEYHKQIIQYGNEEAAAFAYARAQRVREDLVAGERRRARSEGARIEAGRANFQEKLAREEEARRANQQQISKMEKEEAELIQRLQRSQERHRAAFAQLEDAIAGGPGSACASRCSSSMDHVPLSELPQASTSSAGARTPLELSSYASNSAEPRATASRPPRPRPAGIFTPTSQQDSVCSAAGGTTRSRPTSAPRSSHSPAVRSQNRCSRSVTALRDNSSTSICSTASGGLEPESSISRPPSGPSTPGSSAAALPPITYTTADGLQLEISPEDDLDLDKLLQG